MAEPFVEASGVGRSFLLGGQTIEALQPASFRILPQDRIALMGPSGCGKSTLLMLLADLDAPTAGRLNWPALGEHGLLRPTQISVVFQAPSLLPMLSVAENVALPLLIANQPGDPQAEVARALDAIGIADLADKLPEELSGGQAQRVGLARALVGGPRLILADEPTGQLDHTTAQQVFDALLAALEGTDAALVVATHDPDIARRLRTIWRMDHGKLEPAKELQQ